MVLGCMFYIDKPYKFAIRNRIYRYNKKVRRDRNFYILNTIKI